MAGSTAVSSRATVIRLPGRPAPEGRAHRGGVTGSPPKPPEVAARTGRPGHARRALEQRHGRSGRPTAEKPLTTRVNWRSGLATMPCAASSVEELLLAGERGRSPAPLLACVARPPAFRTRSASDGSLSRTITRCPRATSGRALPRGLARRTRRASRRPRWAIPLARSRRQRASMPRPRSRGRTQPPRGYATLAYASRSR